MVFSSILFLLIFLPIFLLVYNVIDKKYKNWFILFSSIIFYSWGAPDFVVILITSTIIDFYIVKYLHQSKNKKMAFVCINIYQFRAITLL